MKKGFAFLVFLILIIKSSAQETTFNFNYFGQTPPDTVVKEFIIPPSIRNNYNFIGSISFSSSGNSIVCGITDSIWSTSKVVYTQKENGRWKAMDTIPFCRNGINTNPTFYNENSIFFSSWLNNQLESTEDFDIFKTVRDNEDWQIASKISELSEDTCREFMGTFSKEGEVYFVRLEKLETPDRSNFLNNEIYSAKIEDGKFTNVKNVGKPVNTEFGEVCPFIDPSGKFLLFGSSREGGHGLVDTYISFRENDGSWIEPQNIKEINTDEFDSDALVTPDGKYLIFIRRQDFSSKIPNRIYWVSSKILDRYK